MHATAAPPTLTTTTAFPSPTQAGSGLTIPIPLGKGAQVLVSGAFPISDAAWSQFMAVLNAMKPGLVQEPPDDGD